MDGLEKLSELDGIEALLTQLPPICFTLVCDGLLDAVPGEEMEEEYIKQFDTMDLI